MRPSRQPVETVIAALKTNAVRGLTTAEAQRRLAHYGKNILPAAPPTPAWQRFLGQFQNPLTTLLLIATVISGLAWIIEDEGGLPYEALAILAIVILNAVLGYVQEHRAEQAVAALQAMSAPTARVLRDGEPKTIPASDVVPGDILLLEEGDTLPADGRVIEASALRVDESALTGESTSVSKNNTPIADAVGISDQHNMIFSGTAVTAGRGRVVVTATGAATEFGKIASTLQQTPEEATPLQKDLDRVGTLLGRVVILIALVMGLTLLFVNQQARSLAQVVDILLLSVSLAVAAVPEGLTAITTIVLSLGMARMARRHVIVRKLNAVETLGSTTVICTDKTGTLTKNEMTVRTVLVPAGRAELTGIGYEPVGELRQEGQYGTDGAVRTEVRYTLRAAVLASNAALVQKDSHWAIQGDPTEGALIVAARKIGITEAELAERYTRVGEVPFSSERKLMSVALIDARCEGYLTIASKGAPDVLLARCTHERRGDAECPLTPQCRTDILALIDRLAEDAMRTLGVAYHLLHRDVVTSTISEAEEHNLVFLGVVGMHDPPRPEAAEAVRVAQQAGVRSIMITGDHPATAVAIAAELGMVQQGGRALTGTELQQTDDQRLRRLVEQVSVFARVAPEHKLRIVRALKDNGAIAAMTGDGVNDAPALKAADIGVAMGITGMDVAKGAADMILTDDNFASIVAAVEEGRTIFANIQKFLRYLLSSNIGEVLVMFGGVVLAGVIGLQPTEGTGLVVPLLATHILWMNLLTDAGPALALGVEPADPRVMTKPPRHPQSRVIHYRMWFDVFSVGSIMMLGTLGVMDWALPGGLLPGQSNNMRYAQTLAFTTLVFFQLFNALNARSDEMNAGPALGGNPWLWLAVGVSIGLQIGVIYLPFLQRPFGTVPLSLTDWVVCIAIGSTVLWLRALWKLMQRRHVFLGRAAC